MGRGTVVVVEIVAASVMVENDFFCKLLVHLKNGKLEHGISDGDNQLSKSLQDLAFKSLNLLSFPFLNPPIVSVSSSCFAPLLSTQDAKRRLGSPRPWRGIKGFSGVTSSPCGLPQPTFSPPTPSPTQHTKLLSPLHLLPEH